MSINATLDPAGMEAWGAGGPVFNQLISSNGDPNILRPWIGKDGRNYVARATGKMIRNKESGKLSAEFKAVPVMNNTATLRKDDWIALDEAVIKAAKPRLRVFGDLRAAGLQMVIPDGMSKTVFQWERQSDISAATVSMDGLRKSQSDRPVYDLQNMPLPIIHKDFSFTLRQLLASRNGGSPLDTSGAELSARRVAEQVEMVTIGTQTGVQFGGGNVYGYTNFPNRITGTGTSPTNAGWTPAQTVTEVLSMKQASINAFHFGPWKLYCSLNWDQYMDTDYNLYQGKTLRTRLVEIEGVESVDTVDYLTNGYQLLLVQQSADVARAVVGMDITTLQWETDGGMLVHFKVMCILLPNIRADLNGNTGLVHNTET